MKLTYQVDNPKRPKVFSIDFTRVLEPDHSAGPPDKMSDGFWPSLDPQDAGWIGPDKTAKDLAKAKFAAQLRMNRWRAGAWQYVGVVCRATIHLPIGGDSFRVFEIDSAGLWGVESDAGDYLDSIYADELADLKDDLRTMGVEFSRLRP